MNKLLAIIICFSFLASCGTTPAPAKPSSIDSADLLMSHSSLGAVEFEQYKLVGDLLFCECGQIRRGRFTPTKQDTVKLKGDEANQVNALLEEIYSASAAELHLDDPGDNIGFFDAGEFELQLTSTAENRSLHTSLNSISNANGGIESTLHALAAQFRKSSAQKICRKLDFYGIGKGARPG